MSYYHYMLLFLVLILYEIIRTQHAVKCIEDNEMAIRSLKRQLSRAQQAKEQHDSEIDC